MFYLYVGIQQYSQHSHAVFRSLSVERGRLELAKKNAFLDAPVFIYKARASS